MKKLLCLSCLSLFAFLPGILFSQIIITQQDFLAQIGTRQVVLEEENVSTTIDVGSSGANQVWDFRNVVISDTVVGVFEFLSPNQTVSATTFLQANFVQKITTPDAPGSIFQFYNFTGNAFINLGDSTFFSGMGIDTSLVYFQNDTLAPLPIAFGNSWMSFEQDTTGFFPITANISFDTTMNMVDGWGTVRLPLGDFECLRLMQEVKAINQTIINGSVISTNTETFIQYNWIGRNSFQLARAQSQDGETNPNFTSARGFGVMDTTSASPPTSIGDAASVPSDFELFQNFPNPFNPQTLIRYDVPQNGQVRLTVYNLRGEKVTELVNEVLPSGLHEVSWFGTDDRGRDVASGIYLYRLQSGKISITKRMIYLR